MQKFFYLWSLFGLGATSILSSLFPRSKSFMLDCNLSLHLNDFLHFSTLILFELICLSYSLNILPLKWNDNVYLWYKSKFERPHHIVRSRRKVHRILSMAMTMLTMCYFDVLFFVFFIWWREASGGWGLGVETVFHQFDVTNTSCNISSTFLFVCLFRHSVYPAFLKQSDGVKAKRFRSIYIFFITKKHSKLYLNKYPLQFNVCICVRAPPVRQSAPQDWLWEIVWRIFVYQTQLI